MASLVHGVTGRKFRARSRFHTRLSDTSGSTMRYATFSTTDDSTASPGRRAPATTSIDVRAAAELRSRRPATMLAAHTGTCRRRAADEGNLSGAGGPAHRLRTFAGTRRYRGQRRTCSAWDSITSRMRARAERARGKETKMPAHARVLHQGADRRERAVRRRARGLVRHAVRWTGRWSSA